MWSRIIYKDSAGKRDSKHPETANLRELFTLPVAEGLYSDIRKLSGVITFPANISFDNERIEESDKDFWNDVAESVPVKFGRLKLFIRPYEDFCRTCIITDREIDQLVQMDFSEFCKDIPGRNIYSPVSDWVSFFRELNYLIPGVLKRIGYEIIRYEEVAEINMLMIKKLARAIHSKYLQEMRTRISRTESGDIKYSLYTSPGSSNRFNTDFDNLPDDIKYSNIDNAAHIPTKLLAVGYKIRQVKKGFKPVTLHLNEDEIETMAKVEHIRWSWEKRLAGWVYAKKKDETRKTHPSLVPYEELKESEKEKDRELVKVIPALLQDIDFEAYPVSPNRIRKLSYAIRPQSAIQKILDETRELNEQIRQLVILTPQVEEMIKIRNLKIEEAIRDVEGSYKYARHIQETFLPDDLFVRECFPESFILFKPKDLVSGDFYFFSKRDNEVIFAAADCTGHGIPGALLSTLGYGIIDQAVNEIKLSDTGEILHHLYSRIHRFLKNTAEESSMHDDMDIILCILDLSTSMLSYSSVRNPIYLISGGEMKELRANNSSTDSCLDGSNHFESDKIHLKTGDTIYLCSDGYIDQFGGKDHKKYQSNRLKDFLHKIYENPLPEQSDLLYEEIEQWRELNHEDQTDDILVIGIRI